MTTKQGRRTPRPARLAAQLNRHRLLRAVVAGAGLGAAGCLPEALGGGRAVPARPFTLGVASGDPQPDGVVLWTRLAPDPLHGGGMGTQAVPVRWEVAADDQLRRVVRSGTATARPELGHSVHVEVDGLEPGRWYWYRFRAGDEVSPTGRTRTAPPAGAGVDRLRFAFVSCQHYEQGYFTAYRHLAQEELDLVVHLGDYIYEGSSQPVAAGRPRSHGSREPVTLPDYRNRYALYKSDPDLQAAHAACPWVVTWDDHEVENNYAGTVDQSASPASYFVVRRASAYQAYYEHMPLRLAQLPNKESLRLYRRLSFGALADFHVLDTRQYRTDQPCGDGNKPRCAAAADPAATLLGAVQERWLLDGLAASGGRWNVLAQQVMMAQVDRTPGDGETYSMDQWAGYVDQRNRLLRFFGERRPSNPVVITGDIHSNWVADLLLDPDDPGSEVVATELVGTSVSSGGDGSDQPAGVRAYLPQNPAVRFYNGQRGYVLNTLTAETWRADYRVVPVVSRPGGTVTTRAAFVVESGRPGAQPA